MSSKLISTFENVGFSHNQSIVLDYLLNRQSWPVQSNDIEREANMRQNAVNLVLRSFVERGWLKETRSVKSEKRRGRPESLYYMNVDRAGIISYIEKTIKSRVNEINNTLSEEARAIILGADA